MHTLPPTAAPSSLARRRAAGFTLVEVLVAMFILAILAGLAFRGVDALVRAKDGALSATDRTLKLNTGMAQFDYDVSQVVDSKALPGVVTFDGATLRIARRTPQGIQLVLWTLQDRRLQRWAGAPVTRMQALTDDVDAQSAMGFDQRRRGDGAAERRRLPDLRVQPERHRGQQFGVQLEQCAVDAGHAGKPAGASEPAGGRRESGQRRRRERERRHIQQPGGRAGGHPAHRRAGHRDRGHRPHRDPPDGEGARGRDLARKRTAALVMTRRRHLRPTLRRRARGAAILLAMLIMTLVATLAAGMVWLQWRGIEVESAERARGQGEWLLNAALDWGNLILKSQVRNGHPDDDLTQPWATPLAETKLSSFLSADGSHSEDGGPEAYLSGQISDESARYNLYNLVASTQPREETLRLAQLCTAIGVPAQVASTIASGLNASFSAQAQNAAAAGQQQQQSSGDAVLMPEKMADLVWLGIDAKTIQQLEPFVTIYPIAAGAPATINANTAPAEVIMVAIPGANLAQAQQIVQRRMQKPFDSAQGVPTAGGISLAGSTVPSSTPGTGAAPLTVTTPIYSVKSDFFEVYGQLRYEQHVIRERSIVHRELNGNVTVLHRERLPPNDPT